MSSRRVLWRWPELLRALDLPVAEGPDIGGISIDSRTLETGDLFIALSGDPGPRFHSSGSSGRDGHDFVRAAESAGAAGMMVSNNVDVSVPLLSVDDTLDGLWALGRYGRKRMRGEVVAITGSSGKTTARQWLEEILERVDTTHASTGSLNNHWGVPLSLARMPDDARFAIFEVGTNNAGEILPLAQLVTPDVAVVLNVLPAHLGRFESFAALTEEKMSIAGGLEGGTLVVPHELREATSYARCLTFGDDSRADVHAAWSARKGRTNVTASVSGQYHEYELPTTGTHRVMTSLAVLAMLHALEVDIARCLPGFSKLTIPKGRGNLLEAGDVVICDDSYNANPVSVGYALEALSQHDGQRVAILGEMLELGGASASAHASLEPQCHCLDGVITVGDGFADWGRKLGARHWGHYNHAGDIELAEFSNRLESGAAVLVKGANKVFWVNDFVSALATALSRR